MTIFIEFLNFETCRSQLTNICEYEIRNHKKFSFILNSKSLPSYPKTNILEEINHENHYFFDFLFIEFFSYWIYTMTMKRESF